MKKCILTIWLLVGLAGSAAPAAYDFLIGGYDNPTYLEDLTVKLEVPDKAKFHGIKNAHGYYTHIYFDDYPDGGKYPCKIKLYKKEKGRFDKYFYVVTARFEYTEPVRIDSANCFEESATKEIQVQHSSKITIKIQCWKDRTFPLPNKYDSDVYNATISLESDDALPYVTLEETSGALHSYRSGGEDYYALPVTSTGYGELSSLLQAGDSDSGLKSFLAENFVLLNGESGGVTLMNDSAISPAGDLYRLNMGEEGKYTFSYKATDNVTNVRNGAVSYFIDNTAPSLEGEVDYFLSCVPDISNGNPFVRLNGLILQWPQAVDLPPLTACGPGGYYYDLKNDPTQFTVDKENRFLAPASSPQVVFTQSGGENSRPFDFTSYRSAEFPRSLHGAVKAQDNLMNEAEDWQLEAAFPFPPAVVALEPPLTFDTRPELTELKPRLENGELLYPVRLELARPLDFFRYPTPGGETEYYIEGIEFYYRTAGSEEEWVKVDQPSSLTEIADEAGGWCLDALTGSLRLDFCLEDDLACNGDEKAHKVFEIAPAYVHKAIHTLEGEVLRELSSTPALLRVPNYRPEFAVRVSVEEEDGSLNRSLDILPRESGVPPQEIVAEAGQSFLFGLSGPELSLIPGTNRYCDPEGDPLSLNLFSVNRAEAVVSGGFVPVSPGEDQPLIYNWSYTQRGKFYLKVRDYYAGTNGEVDGRSRNQDFILTFNKTPPGGTFEIWSGGEEPVRLDPQGVSGSRIVDLKLDTSLASGVQQGVFFNLNPDKLAAPGMLISDDIAEYYTNYIQGNLSPVTGIDIGAHPDTTLIVRDWELLSTDSSTTDLRIVGIRLEAGGLVTYNYRTLYLDMQPPGDFSGGELEAHTRSTGEFALNWEDTTLRDSDEAYILEWRLEGEEFKTCMVIPVRNALPADPHYSAVFALDEVNNPDTEVFFRLRVRDGAGNHGENALYTTGYSLVTSGNLRPGSLHNYAELQGDHYIQRIGLAVDGGSATRYRVSFRMEGTFEESIPVIQEPGAEGELVCSVPEAHRTYHLNVVPVNRGGDPFPGFTTSRSLSNNPPEAAVPLSPSGYSGANLKFRWQEGVDPDNEEVVYQVWIEKAGMAAVNITGTTPGVEGNSLELLSSALPPELVEPNASYQWYVISLDQPEGGIESSSTMSAKMSFVLDLDTPLIDFGYQTGGTTEGLYLNLEELEVRVTSPLSPVEGISYRTSFQDQSSPAINLPVTRAGTQYSARIPLAERTESYTITVNATNSAGNQATATTRELFIDRSLPCILGSSLDDPGDGSPVYRATADLDLTVTASDGVAGVSALAYWLTETPGLPAGEGKLIPVPFREPNNGVKTCELTLPLTGTDGLTRYIHLAALDLAGNMSPVYSLPRPVVPDTTPPLIEQVLSGFESYGGDCYLSALSSLYYSRLEYEDIHSGTREVSFRLRHKEGELVMEDSDPQLLFSTADSLLVTGERYYVEVYAMNNAGLDNSAVSMDFLYDATPPEISDVNGVLPVYEGGSVLSFSIVAADSESPVGYYAISLGTSTEPDSLSRRMNGNSEGWLLSQKPEYYLRLPGEPGEYVLRCIAVNAAGLDSLSAPFDLPLEITRGGETVVVDDGGPYCSDSDVLMANWVYTGSHPLTGYAYSISGPGYDSQEWTAISASELRESAELPAVDGGLYRIAVRAFYADLPGSYAEGSSPGVVYDHTPPEFTDIRLPEIACHKDSLIIGWEAQDNESGIEKVNVLLEMFSPEGELSLVGDNWLQLQPKNSGRHLLKMSNNSQPLLIPDGTPLRLTLRLRNKAGLITDFVSKVFYYDNSPPPVPAVEDMGQGITPEQGKVMEASWLWSVADPHLTGTSYRWALVEGTTHTNGETVWIDGDGSRQLSLSDYPDYPFNPVSGETWYVAVTATNAAGLSSTGFSDGIMIDGSAPAIAEVRLLQGEWVGSLNPEEEKYYLNQTDYLHVFIEAWDKETPVVSYCAGYGTYDTAGGRLASPDRYCNGAGNILDAARPNLLSLLYPEGSSLRQPPSIEEGQLNWFSGEAENIAGLRETGYSSGVLLDTTPPEILWLSGSTTRSSTGSTLTFTWQGENTIPDVPESMPVPVISPLAGYDLELWTEEGEPTTPVDRCTGYTQTTIQWDDLPQGNYYLVVEAVDKARNRSNRKTSATITLDTLSPVITKVELVTSSGNEYVFDHFILEITATDTHSGLEEYAYAVGDSPANYCFTGGDWISGFSNQQLMSRIIDCNQFSGGLSGMHNDSSLYISVKVKDKAGNWSGEYRCSPLKVDNTAASLPEMGIENPFTASLEQVRGLNFSASDSGSGVTRFRAAVVAGEYDEVAEEDWQYTASMPPEPSLHTPAFTLAGLELNHGIPVYIAAQAENAVGLWSETSYLGPVTPDILPPVIDFTAINGVNRGTEFVFNGEAFEVNYTVSDTISQYAETEVTLVGPDHALDVLDRLDGPFAPQQLVCGTSASFIFAYDHVAYGNYTLSIRARDSAGNEKTWTTQPLRHNHPPEVILEEFFYTTPMRPTNLSAVVIDADNGQRDLSFNWVLSDYPHPETLAGFDPFSANPQVRLKQRAQADQLSGYPLAITVTDDDGGSTTRQTVIHVRNTQEGALYTDEYWSGSHSISGDIFVGGQLSLVIAADTEIAVAGNYDPEREGFLLVLQENAVLNAGEGTSFGMASGEIPYWGGILLEGNSSGTLQGVTIRDAERGLTLATTGEVTASNCVFEANRIGLHNLVAGQILNQCLFSGNILYGLKAEVGLLPVYGTCLFTANYIDYYDPQVTRVKLNGGE